MMRLRAHRKGSSSQRHHQAALDPNSNGQQQRAHKRRNSLLGFCCWVVGSSVIFVGILSLAGRRKFLLFHHVDLGVARTVIAESLIEVGLLKPNPWEQQQEEKILRTNKTMLYFTKYFGRVPDWGEGMEPFRTCPVSECVVTSNPKYLPSMSDFDAVFYHGHSDIPIQEPQQVWTWRKPHQAFILMGQESPANRPFTPERTKKQQLSLKSGRADPYNAFFNYTMNYRRDSDIWFPYGFFYPQSSSAAGLGKDEPPKNLSPDVPNEWKDYDEAAFYERLQQKDAWTADLWRLAQRPKKVAWLVTNCKSQSHREQYVKELSKHIQVDIFGACGTIPCELSYDQTNRLKPNTVDRYCDATILADYKFYLSLENSLCDDYVTEKFFSRVNDHVVVTLNQAEYDYAPPHSHINALDYASPKALAEYLHQLNTNDTAYLSYFWWKEHYRVVTPRPTKQAADSWGVQAYWSRMCLICALLHGGEQVLAQKEDDHDSVNYYYANLLQWYQNGSNDAHQHPQCGRLLPLVDKQLRQH